MAQMIIQRVYQQREEIGKKLMVAKLQFLCFAFLHNVFSPFQTMVSKVLFLWVLKNQYCAVKSPSNTDQATNPVPYNPDF